MKYYIFKLSVFSFAFIVMLLSQKGFSQTRLPDGTVIYKDGTRKLPNGTIIYPNGSNKNTGINRTIDGILHPNRNYPNSYPNRNTGRNNNRKWLPPGQAKKRYGGEARDYAPGHNKGRGNRDDENDGDRKDRGHNKNGKGHGHDKDD